MPDNSPIAKEITASIGKLVSESGESVAAQILPRLEELTHSGRVTTEMIPEVMEIIRIEARARGERLRDSRAEQNDVARKPSEISGSQPSPRWTTDKAQLEKAMEDIRDGAPLKVDIYLDDGKLFIEAHTAMTPRVFSIMINLDDLHVLRELPELQELLGELDTLALAGVGGRKLEPEQISEGDVVARDIHTLDGRVYIHKGQEIDAKFISMLNVARELGNIEDSIWVEDDP